MEDSVTDKIIVVELDDNPQNQVLLIRFNYDKELYKVVRQIENSRWNPQLKSWTVPWNTSLLNEIDLLFKDIATIDYRLLEEKIPTKNYQNRNPYFTELSAEAIKKVDEVAVIKQAAAAIAEISQNSVSQNVVESNFDNLYNHLQG